MDDAVKTLCDDKYTTISSDLQIFQNTFAQTNHGKYWQGLKTHDILPKDGEVIKPTIGVKTPTDQPVQYPDFIKNTDLPMSLQINTYDSPTGTGYTIVMVVENNGEKYRRVINTGKETYREQDWHTMKGDLIGFN